MEILCSDKTGTLTQNKLTLGDIQPWAGAEPQAVLLAGRWPPPRPTRIPIDMAVLGGLKDPKIAWRVPTGRVRALRSGLETHRGHDQGGRRQDLFRHQGHTAGDLRAWPGWRAMSWPRRRRSSIDLAAKGYRTLGVARAETAGDWKLLGVLPLFDPPRVDSKETIARGRGVRRQRQDGHRRQRGHRRGNLRPVGPGHAHSSRRRTSSRATSPRGRFRWTRPRGWRRPKASPRSFPSTNMPSSRPCRSAGIWWA